MRGAIPPLPNTPSCRGGRLKKVLYSKRVVALLVKVKLPICFITERHAMEAYWGGGGITPRILDLDTRWK